MMKNIEHSHSSLSIMEHVEIVFHFLLEEIYYLVFYPYA